MKVASSQTGDQLPQPLASDFQFPGISPVTQLGFGRRVKCIFAAFLRVDIQGRVIS